MSLTRHGANNLIFLFFLLFCVIFFNLVVRSVYTLEVYNCNVQSRKMSVIEGLMKGSVAVTLNTAHSHASLKKLHKYLDFIDK